jgi:hypothetical protein
MRYGNLLAISVSLGKNLAIYEEGMMNCGEICPFMGGHDLEKAIATWTFIYEA